jgi:CRISPR-associated RAMP protein (TIGR02581 family)
VSETSSTPVADFHRLRERLRWNGVIETKTALRIGSGGGGDMDGSDLPVLRDADGFPLIPGSSLKGVIRSTIEALVRGAGMSKERGEIWTCDPLADNKSPERACGWHGGNDENKRKRNEAIEEPHCVVCRLFGSHVVASHVRFSDALLVDAETMKRRGRIPIEVRDGVAIDRDLRTAYGGQKYDFEVIAPGTRFDLEVFIENPHDWLLGLLAIGFDQVADGFSALGGFTSRGLGRVAIQWSGMTRVDARALLEGSDAKVFDAAQMRAQFDLWRAALAAKVKGVA